MEREGAILCAGLFVSTCAGLHYSFSTYSEDLRLRLHLTQQEVEVIALGKDLGAYAGVFQGLFYDKFGPRRTLVVGGFLTFFGYASVYLLMSQQGVSRRVPLWQPFIALFVAANGGGWLDMAALVTLLHNSGAERAITSGVVKALLGLGAAVFSSVYAAFLAPNSRLFLLLCACVPLCVSLAASPVISRLPRVDAAAPRRSPARAKVLWALSCWVAVLISYLFLATALLSHPSKRLRVASTAALCCLLFIPPPLITGAGSRARSGAVAPPTRDGGDDPRREPLLADNDASAEEAAHALPPPETAVAASSPPPRLRGQRCGDLSVSSAVSTPEFWLLFFALATGGGGSLILFNNLGQLVHSLGSRASASEFVALLSVCNAAGRLAQGAASDAASSHGVPRPAFLVASLACLSSILFALSSTSDPLILFPATAIVGFAFGSLWSFAPVAVVDLFGEKAAGSVYGCLGASPAVGGFLLNTLVAGRVYEAHATNNECFGKACFGLTFKIGALACAAGTAAAFVLFRRTAHMYAGRK